MTSSVNRLFESVFKWIIKRPVLTLILTGTLVSLLAAGSAFLGFTNDYQSFFSDSNPQLAAFKKMEDTYSGNDNALIMLSPKSGDVFNTDVLEAILLLTDDAWKVSNTRRVDSISNYQYSYGLDDELIIEDLYTESSLDNIAKIRDRALSEPLIAGRLVSKDGKVAAVNITFALSKEHGENQIPHIAGEVAQLVQDFETRYPDIQFYQSGVLLLDNAISTATIKDISILIPITYLVIAITSALVLQTLLGTLATIVIIVSAIGVAMGVSGWLGIVLTPPSASVPSIVMTLAVADCVHVITIMRQQLFKGLAKGEALLYSLKHNLSPLILTSVTTAIGFLSLNFSDAPPFRDLGNMTAIGVIAAMLLALTMLPALLMVLPIKPPKNNNPLHHVLEKVATMLVRYSLPLIIIVGVGAVATSLFLARNQLNDNFVEYFGPEHSFRADSEAITKDLTGVYYIDYSIDAGQADGIYSPEYLAFVERFENWLREQPEVRHVNSVLEIIKRLNFNLHEDNTDYRHIPESRDEVAQYILLYEMSLPVGLDLNSQINVDKSSTRVTASLDYMATSAVLELESRVNKWLSGQPENFAVSAASPTLMFSHISIRNIQGLLKGTFLALLLISLLLIFALKSMRLGVISLVSNLLPAMVGFGVWALLIGQVSLGVSVVLSLTLGIVVDDTIHLLARYKRAREEQGLSPADAVHAVMVTSGVSVTSTTLILCAGFLVLAFSNFQVNSHMGLLSTIILVVALIIDLLLVLPLLCYLDKRAETTTTTAA